MKQREGNFDLIETLERELRESHLQEITTVGQLQEALEVRAKLREALTRAAENMKVAAEFHACVNCAEGHTQALTALAVARTIEKYGGAMAELAKEQEP